MEWVQNTIPIGTYLTTRANKPGAHDRFRPMDWKHSDIRKMMSKAKTSGDPQRLRHTFLECCAHHQPVFRYFFLEYFGTGGERLPASVSASSASIGSGADYGGGAAQTQLSSLTSSGSIRDGFGAGGGAAEWYERRLTYSTSLAVSSMVGHIMGIGDRHTQNILIDTRTAEVVHIDFGIVFEQGKILQTPETVPFRLTRDMVDGLGITGVEVRSSIVLSYDSQKSPPLKLRRYLSAMDPNTFLIRHTFMHLTFVFIRH